MCNLKADSNKWPLAIPHVYKNPDFNANDEMVGSKSDAGIPHVRFDESEQLD